MPSDPERLRQELSILADLHSESDPLLASLGAAIFVEDADGVVFSDLEIEAGLDGPSAVARVTGDNRWES